MRNDHLRTSKVGVELIASFEGCRLKPYQDAVGVWTIGYGHTGPGTKNMQLHNVAEAKALLAKDLKRYEEMVRRLVRVSLTQHQFDALVSAVYNLGPIVITDSQSTLARHLNAKHFARAANHFLDWDRAGGQVLSGLLRRRKAERALFLKGCTRRIRVAARTGIR
jgi:lysozyme